MNIKLILSSRQLKLKTSTILMSSFNIDFETTGKFIFTSTYNIFQVRI